MVPYLVQYGTDNLGYHIYMYRTHYRRDLRNTQIPKRGRQRALTLPYRRGLGRPGSQLDPTEAPDQAVLSAWQDGGGGGGA